MLDRESACDRVFLARRFVLFGADGVGLRFEPARSFSSWPLPRGSTMSSPLPYCRTNQTSSDVGMIGMITASARRRCTYRDAMEPSENSSMISRASRARVRARRGGFGGPLQSGFIAFGFWLADYST